MSTLLYLDSSALVKLVIPERESRSLRAELPSWPSHASSVIAEVEVHRAALRAGGAARDADAVLDRISRLAIDDALRQVAQSVGSRHLRALDAIHLATALSLGGDLGAFCCYDRRLAADAEAAGLTVLSPGLD